MQKVQTKLTSQGQVSVPAAVRSLLHLVPGSVLVWSQEGDRIVVERGTRHTTAEVHEALFANEQALKNGRTPKQLMAALELLLAHESLVIQESDTVTAALASFRARPALGFSDCLVLEIARKAGHLPLATLDKTLGKRPGGQRLQ